MSKDTKRLPKLSDHNKLVHHDEKINILLKLTFQLESRTATDYNVVRKSLLYLQQQN